MILKLGPVKVTHEDFQVGLEVCFVWGIVTAITLGWVVVLTLFVIWIIKQVN